MEYRKVISDSKEHNNVIKEKISDYLKNNPIEGAHKKIVFDKVEFKEPADTFNEIIKAQKEHKTISSKVYANAKVINKHTGTIEDEKKVFLGNALHKTKLGTYIVDGSHYVVPHQFRLKPSGYTSIKNDGNTETMFNVANGIGMKVVSPQNKNEIYTEIGSRKFNTYDILKLMGATDEEIKKKIGTDLYHTLKIKSNPEKTYKSLAEATKTVSTDKANTPDGLKQLREVLESGKLDKEATKHTLGIEADNMNKDVIMHSIKKVIGVKKGNIEQDDKENLIFKKVVPPDELMIEGVKRKMNAELWKKRAPLNKFNPVKVEDVVNEPLLSKASKHFITTSAISRMPEGYNPLQVKQVGSDVTPMGEGGIKSTETISPSMRGLHLSQLGYIDPIKSPEGANTGITLSLTEGAYIDKDHNPAMLVKNLKTGKLEIKRIKDLWDKKIAFPDADHKGRVGIRYKNIINEGHIKNADYQIPDHKLMYGPAMNSLGLISANDPTRNLMASKHITQALPLVERDIPHVVIKDSNGKVMLEEYAKEHLPVAQTNGVITKIDHKEGYIHIKDEKGKTNKVSFASEDLPLNAKTSIKHFLKVKVGDKVKKDQILADSNYTKDGQFALGKNLRTAFMMYPGTRNDAFVISESAAKKMTSYHTMKHEVLKDKNTEFSKKKFVTLFPDMAKKINLDKYGEDGFPKEGVVLEKGEPLFLGVKKADEEEVKFANDKVKKLLFGGYMPYVDEWKYPDPAKVENIHNKGKKSRMYLSYTSPLKVGDKIAGRSGNKGIISKVIPDKEMPRTEDGKPIDVILGGAGVASRQNPAQIIEAALGAVSEKTGKQYKIPHFVTDDLSEFAKQEAKKHGVKLEHKVYDPVRKKQIAKPVFVGNYHIQKLFKQGDTAWSAVGYGPTDGMDQPKKGGKISASSISNMEVNALLAHGAKDFLRETFKIRSQKNRDWFSAYMKGDSILPVPEDKTSIRKFKALLNQMNIKVEDNDKEIKLTPMTDKDVLKLSNGEVKEPYGLKHNTLKEVPKGFYDPKIFGGNGNYYGHIDLGEKIINPLYKNVIAKSLNISTKEIDKQIEEGKISDLEKQIKNINLNNVETRLKREIKNTKDSNKINQAVRTIKAIKKLKDSNTHLKDVGLISKIPVIPTMFRGVSKLPNGTIVDHDINNHYSAIIDSANTLKEAKKELGNKHEITGKLRTELQKHIGAMYGINKSPDPALVKKEIKSVQEIISGKKPKESLWQQNVLQNKVFTSGRAVIIPKEKYLPLDQVEIPKDVAWNIFSPHVHRKMAQAGMDTTSIQEHIENKTPTAKRFLDETMKEVPVVINRAPTLHKHSMIGAYAKIGSGTAMKISPLHENPLNADYDGDQLAIHAPITQKAIDDVKNKLLASKQMFGASSNENLQMQIDLDPYIGFYHASKYPTKK